MENEIKSATFTIKEAAKLLGISRSACYEAAKNGQLPILKIGSRFLVPKLALEKLLTSSTIAQCN